jgi:hypothetical protein
LKRTKIKEFGFPEKADDSCVIDDGGVGAFSATAACLGRRGD